VIATAGKRVKLPKNTKGEFSERTKTCCPVADAKTGRKALGLKKRKRGERQS